MSWTCKCGYKNLGQHKKCRNCNCDMMKPKEIIVKGGAKPCRHCGWGKQKHFIKFEVSQNGVCIWVNGRWVLDASTFFDTLTLNLCNKRLKKEDSLISTFDQYRFNPDKRDKRSL